MSSLQKIAAKVQKGEKQANFYWRWQGYCNRDKLSIRIGRMGDKTAHTVARHIDHLVSAKEHAVEVRESTQAWLLEAKPDLVAKLAKHGLCKVVQPKTVELDNSWSSLVESFLDFQSDKSDGTRTNYRVAAQDFTDWLNQHHKRLKDIGKVTTRMAFDFYRWQKNRDSKVHKAEPQKLSLNTIHRRMGRLKQIFDYGLANQYIEENPFNDKLIKKRSDEAKKQYVSDGQIRQIVKCIPPEQLEWKLLFVFARWIGCRIPSEIKTLTWDLVDWDAGIITIRDQKRSKANQLKYRRVPIFDDVRGPLKEQFNANQDSGYVFDRLRHTSNLATTSRKKVVKAKVEPWSNFFNTLRASCETDLMDRYGLRKACAWIGNSPDVAMKHYALMHDRDFEDVSNVAVVASLVDGMDDSELQRVAELLEKRGSTRGSA